MQDGYTQVGAGDSDMRIAGKDLQHSRQTADEGTNPARLIRQNAAQGGPVREALARELERHNEAQGMRVQQLQQHYKR